MLSSLQGSAITAIRIDGVLHEFTSVPDVLEDVTEIILNLKQVRFKAHTLEPRVLRIDVTRDGAVTAADIIADPQVDVLNPEQHIATLNEGGRLVMELTVRSGYGYVPAERNKTENMPVGTIPIDSMFSPVVRVNYNVNNARVGQRTDYDRLPLRFGLTEVSLQLMLLHTGQILKEQVQIFINLTKRQSPSTKRSRSKTRSFKMKIYTEASMS